MATQLKVHRFQDCAGFPWRESVAVRHRRSTLDLRRVTCGACKQRILNVVVQRDWAKLFDAEREVLEIAAAEVEVDE